jgi:EpsD family peptidyl-prolyl cis-trans isomerase
MAVAMMSAGLMSACNKEPGGQVVAVVDDQEITQQDVRAEAAANNITNKAALEEATAGIVRRLVDRTVLSDYARDNNLDRGPEYVGRRRQMEESLLAYLALRKLVGNLDQPTPGEARSYIAANPLTFAQRQRLTLDQVRFPKPAQYKAIQELVRLPTLDAVEAKLRAGGTRFVRVPADFDTGATDPSLAKKIAGLRDGDIFDLTMGGTTYISQIKGRTLIPTESSGWKAQAMNILRRKKLSDVLTARTNALKKSAKIRYDAAYQPKDS